MSSHSMQCRQDANLAACQIHSSFSYAPAANRLASKGIPVTVYDMGTRGPGNQAHPLPPALHEIFILAGMQQNERCRICDIGPILGGLFASPGGVIYEELSMGVASRGALPAVLPARGAVHLHTKPP